MVDPAKELPRKAIPYLTRIVHGSAPFITTFLLIHLTAPAIASLGGSSLSSQTMVRMIGTFFAHFSLISMIASRKRVLPDWFWREISRSWAHCGPHTIQPYEEADYWASKEKTQSAHHDWIRHNVFLSTGSLPDSSTVSHVGHLPYQRSGPLRIGLRVCQVRADPMALEELVLVLWPCRGCVMPRSRGYTDDLRYVDGRRADGVC